MTTTLAIKEIKQKLAGINSQEDPFIQQMKEDPRKGVQQLYQAWLKKEEKQLQLRNQFEKMKEYEVAKWAEGYQLIGGVDEVGRGPLAGPVVTSCVILPKNFYLLGLTDSKQLTKERREEYFQRIMEEAIAVGIGIATAKEIDIYNIYQATKLAMERAIDQASMKPDYLLLDAMELPVGLPQTSIIKGDAKSISIAASSVIAKVTRDRYMEEVAIKYPQYGFERHMGYGTKEHIKALEIHGITEEHRRSFAPVRDAMNPLLLPR